MKDDQNIRNFRKRIYLDHLVLENYQCLKLSIEEALQIIERLKSKSKDLSK